MLFSLILLVLALVLGIFTPFIRNIIFSRGRLALFYLFGQKHLGTDTPALTIDPPPPQNLLFDEKEEQDDASESAAAAAPAAQQQKKKKKSDMFFPAGTVVRITMIRHGESVGNIVATRKDEFKEKRDAASALALVKSLGPALCCESEMLLTQLHGGSYSDWPLTAKGEAQAVQLRTMIESKSIGGFPSWFNEAASGATSPTGGAETPASTPPTTPRGSPRRAKSPTSGSSSSRKAKKESYEGKERVLVMSSQLKRAMRTMQLALHPLARNAGMSGGAIIDSALQETCPHFDSQSPLSHRPNPQTSLFSDMIFPSWRIPTGPKSGLNLLGFNRYRSYLSGAVAALDDPSAAPAQQQRYSDDSLWRRMDSFVASVFARSTSPELLPYCAMIGKEERNSRRNRRNSSSLSSRRGGGGGGHDEFDYCSTEDLAASTQTLTDEKPLDRVCLVGHGSWIRRFFTRYLPLQDDIVDEKAKELALTLRTKGLSNTATVEFDLVLAGDGVPRILPRSLALHRGEVKTLNLVSPATKPGTSFSTPASPAAPVAAVDAKKEEVAAIENSL